ncbi:hypothetical protein CPB84DRAFT_1762258 [Gymnopilus junonius]|uniref:Uncharacterized protein n=1 Tax=Gymnopilus junonius TaxID=109634 RepID=A0A9P5P232_GYMJU|nr:hypothetical protein CPB84DRAFT_1762258 [Gymnopilus junonius]
MKNRKRTQKPYKVKAVREGMVRRNSKTTEAPCSTSCLLTVTPTGGSQEQKRGINIEVERGAEERSCASCYDRLS